MTHLADVIRFPIHPIPRAACSPSARGPAGPITEPADRTVPAPLQGEKGAATSPARGWTDEITDEIVRADMHARFKATADAMFTPELDVMPPRPAPAGMVVRWSPPRPGEVPQSLAEMGARALWRRVQRLADTPHGLNVPTFFALTCAALIAVGVAFAFAASVTPYNAYRLDVLEAGQ